MSVMYSLVSVIKKSLSVSNTFSGIFRAEHGQNIRDFDHNLSMRFEFGISVGMSDLSAHCS